MAETSSSLVQSASWLIVQVVYVQVPLGSTVQSETLKMRLVCGDLHVWLLGDPHPKQFQMVGTGTVHTTAVAKQ